MTDKNASSQINPKIFHEILEEMGEPKSAPEAKSPWAKAASEMRELLKQESPEVQATHHEMDSGRMRYPEYRKAKREREQEEDSEE